MCDKQHTQDTASIEATAQAVAMIKYIDNTLERWAQEDEVLLSRNQSLAKEILHHDNPQ